MSNLLDYALAGYEGRQTDAMYSSSCWSAEQAGKQCRKIGLFPLEVTMSKGYSVRVNRDYIVKFNTKTLEFESITRR
jgi:hypothetical protein